MSIVCSPLPTQERSSEPTSSIQNPFTGTTISPTADPNARYGSRKELSLSNDSSFSPTFEAQVSKDQSDGEKPLWNSSISTPPRNEELHYCHKCSPPKGFRKKHQLTTHQRRHEPPFECERLDCKKRFQYRKDLTRHLKTVHAKHDLDNECFPCPFPSCIWSLEKGHRGFTRPDSLRRHVQKVHNTLSASASVQSS